MSPTFLGKFARFIDTWFLLLFVVAPAGCFYQSLLHGVSANISVPALQFSAQTLSQPSNGEKSSGEGKETFSALSGTEL